MGKLLVKLKKVSPIHPFLFAIFPVLFLFAYNIDEVAATDLLLPIVVVIVGTLIIFFSLRLITKSYSKIGIITSYFLILFFSYGRIRDLIVSLELGQFFNQHVGFFLGPLWLLLFATGAFFVIKSHGDFPSFTKFLNITAITLVTISLINISIYEIKTASLTPAGINKEGDSLNLNDSENLRDIYYIILDSYASQSTLAEIYNYDNSEFIDYLTDKGFYVASESRTNYVRTRLSLPSSLNMEHVNYLSDTVGIESGDYTVPNKMVQNNKVSQLLKSVGYRYIYMSEGIFLEGMSKYAEVYTGRQDLFGIRISAFTAGLIETTAADYFISPWMKRGAREAILYIFDSLEDIPNIKEPTFVFAHVNPPHVPFLFDRDGNPVEIQDNTWQNKQAYLDQLIFVNKKVKSLVDEILLKSDIAPIIILQADHGPKSTQQSEFPYDELTNIQIDERFNIFNAYFLPEGGNRLLYESITPVNSFRLIFNYYFGANYDLLEDESYYSIYTKPYKLSLVPPEASSD